jgi:hypothetical protein
MAEPPFRLDPGRLYDVGRDGVARTDRATAPQWLDARHRALLGWAACGAGLTGGLAGLSVVCLALGARDWAAAFALAVLAAAPVLTVGPMLDWWRHRRPLRQRHRRRPEGFG